MASKTADNVASKDTGSARLRRGRARSRGARTWARRLLVLSAVLLAVQYFLAGSNLTFHSDDEADIQRATRTYGRAWMPRRVLVVTAHPDDEVMFFAPAIVALVRAGVRVHALCLSTGNADALGDVRRRELNASYARLGVAAAHDRDDVTLIDDEDLQDGMQRTWDEQRIARYIVKQAHERGPYDAVLTFDQHGVSQHANHVACYRAARAIVQAHTLTPSTALYALRSYSVPPTKFLALPAALVRHSTARIQHLVVHTARTSAKHTPGLLQPGRPLVLPPSTLTFLSTPRDYVRALHAMLQHRSQLVWFRYLYLLLSSHMYGVQLDLIE